MTTTIENLKPDLWLKLDDLSTGGGEVAFNSGYGIGLEDGYLGQDFTFIIGAAGWIPQQEHVPIGSLYSVATDPDLNWELEPFVDTRIGVEDPLNGMEMAGWDQKEGSAIVFAFYRARAGLFSAPTDYPDPHDGDNIAGLYIMTPWPGIPDDVTYGEAGYDEDVNFEAYTGIPFNGIHWSPNGQGWGGWMGYYGTARYYGPIGRDHIPEFQESASVANEANSSLTETGRSWIPPTMWDFMLSGNNDPVPTAWPDDAWSMLIHYRPVVGFYNSAIVDRHVIAASPQWRLSIKNLSLIRTMEFETFTGTSDELLSFDISGKVSLGRWHAVCIRWNGTTLELIHDYINIEDSAIPATGFAWRKDGWDEISVGYEYDHSARSLYPLQGWIGAIAFWDYPISNTWLTARWTSMHDLAEGQLGEFNNQINLLNPSRFEHHATLWNLTSVVSSYTALRNDPVLAKDEAFWTGYAPAGQGKFYTELTLVQAQPAVGGVRIGMKAIWDNNLIDNQNLYGRGYFTRPSSTPAQVWENGALFPLYIAYSEGDILRFAWDSDTGELWLAINNYWVHGDPTLGEPSWTDITIADGVAPAVVFESGVIGVIEVAIQNNYLNWIPAEWVNPQDAMDVLDLNSGQPYYGDAVRGTQFSDAVLALSPQGYWKMDPATAFDTVGQTIPNAGSDTATLDNVDGNSMRKYLSTFVENSGATSIYTFPGATKESALVLSDGASGVTFTTAFTIGMWLKPTQDGAPTGTVNLFTTDRNAGTYRGVQVRYSTDLPGTSTDGYLEVWCGDGLGVSAGNRRNWISSQKNLFTRGKPVFVVVVFRDPSAFASKGWNAIEADTAFDAYVDGNYLTFTDVGGGATGVAIGAAAAIGGTATNDGQMYHSGWWGDCFLVQSQLSAAQARSLFVAGAVRQYSVAGVLTPALVHHQPLAEELSECWPAVEKFHPVLHIPMDDSNRSPTTGVFLGHNAGAWQGRVLNSSNIIGTVVLDGGPFTGLHSFNTNLGNGPLMTCEIPEYGFGDFTLEFWFKRTDGLTTQAGICTFNSSPNSISTVDLAVVARNTGGIGVVVGGVLRAGGSDTMTGWTHVCLMRRNVKVFVYQGGSLAASYAQTNAMASGNKVPGGLFIEWLILGGGFVSWMGGEYSDIRFTQGVALYPTAGFTPPIAPHPVTDGFNVISLFHYNDAQSTTAPIDSALFPRAARPGYGNPYAYVDTADSKYGTGSLLCAEDTGGNPGWANTRLLVPAEGDDGDTVIPDLSQYAATPTLSGATEISDTQAYFGNTSISFPNAVDYLEYNDAQLAGHTADIEIAFWLYPAGTQADLATVFDNNFASPINYIRVDFDSANHLRLYINDVLQITTASVVAANTWTHVLISAGGQTAGPWITNEVVVYLNGVEDSPRYTGTVNLQSATHRYGTGVTTPANGFVGFMDQIQVIHGFGLIAHIPPHARSNPVPPTAAIYAVDDPHSANVELMLHFDEGLGEDTNFNDDSSNAFTLTRVGTITGNVVNEYLGGAGCDFAGTGEIYTPSDVALKFGTGDFTVDFWLKIPTASTGVVFDTRLRPSVANAIALTMYIAGNQPNILINGVPQWIMTALTYNVWYFFAIQRRGTVIEVYVDGERRFVRTGSTEDFIGQQLTIGRGADSSTWPLNGVVDEFRYTVGTARYDNNFAVPTAPAAERAIEPVHTEMLVDKTFWQHSREFTFEFWVKFPELPSLVELSTMTGGPIAKNANQLKGAWWISTLITGQIQIFQGFNISTWSNFTTYTAERLPLPAGQWMHMVLQRVNTDAQVPTNDKFYFFVDGVLHGSTAGFNTYLSLQNELILTLGGKNSTGVRFDDMRLTQCRAIYPLSSPGLDQDFASVELLLHGDGADDATVFTDDSSNALSPTVSGTVVTSIDEFQFGTASIFYPLAVDNLLYNDAVLALGTSDWTFEVWIYQTSQAVLATVFSTTDGGANAVMVDINTDGTLNFWCGTGYEATSVGAVALNTWTHLAVERSGSTVSMWQDGVRLYTGANPQASYSGNQVRLGTLGGDTSKGLIGYTEEFRLTLVARFGAALTIEVPTVAYPNAVSLQAFLPPIAQHPDPVPFAQICLTTGAPVIVPPIGGYANRPPNATVVSDYFDELTTTAMTKAAPFYDRDNQPPTSADPAQVILLTVTALPTKGTVYYQDMVTPVLVNDVLTETQWLNLFYTSVAWVGSYPLFEQVGAFEYYLTDDGEPIGTSGTGYYIISINAVLAGEPEPPPPDPDPPEEPEPPAPVPGDYQNPRLLLHFNEADGAVDMVDSSLNVWTPIHLTTGRPLGTQTQGQIDTAEKKFGSASLYLSAINDRFAVGGLNGSLGFGSFTIDMWVRPTLNVGLQLLTNNIARMTDNSGWAIYTFNGELRCKLRGWSTTAIYGGLLALNTWQHIALSGYLGVDGSEVRLFIDGAQTGATFTGVPLADGGATFYMGSILPIAPQISTQGINTFQGWVDELRFVKGTSLYSGPFTPPVAQTPDP